MAKTIDILLGAAALVFGGIGIGYGIHQKKRVDDVFRKLDKAVDEAVEDLEIEVPERLVNLSVERAVKEEVTKAVKEQATVAAKEVERDMKHEIKKAIDKQYSNIEDKVVKEVNRKVGNIDISSIKRAVIEEAKGDANRKFNDNLDDILEKFNDQLDAVSKIYSSMADTMKAKTSGGGLKLSLE